jgi:hypothetical protein
VEESIENHLISLTNELRKVSKGIDDDIFVSIFKFKALLSFTGKICHFF